MFLLFLLAASTAAHPQLLDKEVLEQIFETSPTPGPEDLTVRSTAPSLTSTDGSCRCVPYYLCEDNLTATEATHDTLLDIAFGDDECPDTILEVCCKSPKTEPSTARVNKTRPAGCGYRNRDWTFNWLGDEALFGEFPWVVAILNASGRYLGIGSLIHPQVVITAAHVVSKYTPGSLKIRAGEWDTQTTQEQLPYQERAIGEHYIHADFSWSNLTNDVALLRLSEAVTLDEHIGLLCLPEQGENFQASQECVVNGWGKDLFDASGRYSTILKRVILNMIPNQQCNQLLKQTRLGNNFKLHDSFACTAGVAGTDTCHGDSGAPLACPIGGDRYKLAGLTAFGIGCGERFPSVYAAVPLFRQWVDDKMAAWGYDSASYTV